MVAQVRQWVGPPRSNPAPSYQRLAGRPEDLLASAVELVARHVAEGLARFAPAGFPETAPVAVAGGGLANLALREALERRLGPRVGSSADHGVDPDAREALVFGVLAARCVLGIPSSDPRATGARAGRVLGKLSPGPGLGRS